MRIRRKKSVIFTLHKPSHALMIVTLTMVCDTQVMPYSHGPAVKKLSKMSTLLLARNYIVMLTRSLEEMRRLLQDMTSSRALPHQPYPHVLPSLSPSALLTEPSSTLTSSLASLTSAYRLPVGGIPAPTIPIVGVSSAAAKAVNTVHSPLPLHGLPGLPCACSDCQRKLTPVWKQP